MPRQQLVQAFNKEKLLFLLAALALAGGVYLFVITSPHLLEAGQPASMDPLPAQPKDTAPPTPEPEDYWVVDGSITQMIDRLTGQPVNRRRKTPFMPDADFLAALGNPARRAQAAKPEVAPLPPPPPLPLADAKVRDKNPRNERRGWDAKDAESQVEYKGVVTISGQTYGMLSPKDGGKMLNVKVGELIPGLDYTVRLIEKQAITVADSDGNIFLLRDMRFSEGGDTSSADSGAKGEDPVGEGPGKGGGGKGKDKGGKGKDKGKKDKGGQVADNKGPPAGPAAQPGPRPPGGGPGGGPGGRLADKLQGLDPKILDKIKANLARMPAGQ